jgi:hypothetical protein
MKFFPAVVAAVLSAIPAAAQDRELPPVMIHEWGVLSWGGPGPDLSGTPELLPFFQDDGGMLLRAPVLYIHGPEFTGTITVTTGNGTLSAVYPEASGGGVGQTACSWYGSFGYSSPDSHLLETAATVGGHGTGTENPWPYSLWRTGQGMTCTSPCGWSEEFLYYETIPERLDFLPYLPGAEPVPARWRDIPALVIRQTDLGPVWATCSLGGLAGETPPVFRDMHPDSIHEVLREWSRDMIDVEEVDALWNTWTGWICREHRNDPAYLRGLVIYRVPEELLDRLSIIDAEVESPSPFPVRARRYILAAVPL